VVTIDDIDGSANAQTVTFGLDGVTYEIDLSEGNKARLERAVAPFMAAGRRVSRRTAAPARRQAAQVDRAAVRAWARQAGLKVSERGRISADVLRQYEAAH
jgi:Lsr2